jgi:hypothetical protein
MKMRQQVKIRLFLGLTGAFLLWGPGAVLAQSNLSDLVEIVANNVYDHGNVGSKVIEQFKLTEEQEAHGKFIQKDTKGIVIDLLESSGEVSDRFILNPYKVTLFSDSDKDNPRKDTPRDTPERVRPLAFTIVSDTTTLVRGESDILTAFINGRPFRFLFDEHGPESLKITFPRFSSEIFEDRQDSDRVVVGPVTVSFASDTDTGSTRFGPIPEGYIHLTAPEKDNVVTYELRVTSF